MAPSPFDRRRISDKDLKVLCEDAIQKGLSKTRALDELRAIGISIGEVRMQRMWAACDGPLQYRQGGWI